MATTEAVRNVRAGTVQVGDLYNPGSDSAEMVTFVQRDTVWTLTIFAGAGTRVGVAASTVVQVLVPVKA